MCKPLRTFHREISPAGGSQRGEKTLDGHFSHSREKKPSRAEESPKKAGCSTIFQEGYILLECEIWFFVRDRKLIQ